MVTADGRTAGDVLTYVSLLITDDDGSNDELAKDLTEQVNLQQQIAAGIVPSGGVLYRGGVQRTVWTFEAPREFSLSQNYPYPFNPSTTIRFTVEKTNHATLEILRHSRPARYDAL